MMLCILPINDTNDVTLQIHSTLIEAFCWENDINLIKVRVFWESWRFYRLLIGQRSEMIYFKTIINNSVRHLCALAVAGVLIIGIS